MKFVAVFVACIMVGLGLTWVVQGNDFFLYQYFAPKTEQVRREVFEKSKAYNQGMLQELDSLYIDWVNPETKPVQKDAICAVVRHRYADYNDANLPGYLRTFIHDCQHPY